MSALIPWSPARSSVSAGPKHHPTQPDQPKLIVLNNALSRSRAELSKRKDRKGPRPRGREGSQGGKGRHITIAQVTRHFHMCGQAFFKSAGRQAGRQAGKAKVRATRAKGGETTAQAAFLRLRGVPWSSRVELSCEVELGTKGLASYCAETQAEI